MRLGGIASGMDTEKMVKELMNAEKVRVNKYYRQQESIKWKQEALNTTNKVLADFILKARSGFGLTSTSSTGSILNKGIDTFDWVKKASSSDESIIKATATNKAMEGRYDINVTGLAAVASVTSENIDGLLNNGKFTEAGSFTIETNKGTAVTIEIDGETTIAGLLKQINDATGKDANGKDVNLGLRAAYDSKLGRLMIATKDQGVEQFIKIQNNEFAKKIFGATNAAIIGEEVDGVSYDEARGRSAKLTVNDNTITQNSNNFTMFGVNYQLQSTGKVTLNVESNVDGVVEKVKDFVKEYNALIDVLNGLLKEKTHKGYTPLLQEEREAMKDKEIELWEAKAKSGILSNDASITRMMQDMRSGLYENVYETGSKDEADKLSGFNHITQIGITTGNYQSGGRLEINEEKLRQAIIDNPDGVINLLFKKSNTTKITDSEGKVIREEADKRRASSGLVERLFDGMISGMKDIVRRSGTGDNANLYRNVQSNMLIDFVTSGSISLLDKDLTSIGSRITREESLLVSKETRYWNQFTAMEKAMQKMNSQSSWLYAQMGM